MPHACIATNSRSADRRPRPNRIPKSSAIGIVTHNACGVSVHKARRIVVQATPFEIICSALDRIGGIISAKVRPTSARTNGGTISRTM